MIPADAFLPIWVLGGIVMFFGWLAFGAFLSRGTGKTTWMWQPALYWAIGWPVWVGALIAFSPLWLLFMLFRDRPKT